jgi:hypothetical protein
MENATDNAGDKKRHHPEGDICKFLEQPLGECYCLNVSSRRITKLLSLCGGNFRSCAIYTAENEKSNKSGS